MALETPCSHKSPHWCPKASGRPARTRSGCGAPPLLCLPAVNHGEPHGQIRKVHPWDEPAGVNGLLLPAAPSCPPGEHTRTSRVLAMHGSCRWFQVSLPICYFKMGRHQANEQWETPVMLHQSAAPSSLGDLAAAKPPAPSTSLPRPPTAPTLSPSSPHPRTWSRRSPATRSRRPSTGRRNASACLRRR